MGPSIGSKTEPDLLFEPVTPVRSAVRVLSAATMRDASTTKRELGPPLSRVAWTSRERGERDVGGAGDVLSKVGQTDVSG